MASKKTTVPYDRIAAMANEGLGALEIAKKTNRLIEGNDPGHSIRAILSKMRSSGWRDKDGKLRKLKVERVGTVKKATKAKSKPKAVKKASKKAAPKKNVNGNSTTETTTSNGGGQ